MKNVKLKINDREIVAKEGEYLLKVCLDNGIYIPNLCYMKNIEPPRASCRMCFVEVVGIPYLVTSCTTKVYDGMIVKTDTEEIKKLQKWGLELLLSTQENLDDIDENNELRKIADYLGVPLKLNHFEFIPRETNIDFNTNSHPYIDYDYKKCILCGRCVETCKKLNKEYHIDFGKRGYNSVITFFEKKEISDSHCGACFACVKVCPVGALKVKDKMKKEG